MWNTFFYPFKLSLLFFMKGYMTDQNTLTMKPKHSMKNNNNNKKPNPQFSKIVLTVGMYSGGQRVQLISGIINVS